jgi:hypothetical protein
VNHKIFLFSYTSPENYRYPNTSIKLSVAIAGVCLIELYIYITQQDAPHKNKKKVIISVHSWDVTYITSLPSHSTLPQ